VVGETEGDGVGVSLGLLVGVGVVSMLFVGVGAAAVGGGTTGRMSAGFAGAAAARRWLRLGGAAGVPAVLGDSFAAVIGGVIGSDPLALAFTPASEPATARYVPAAPPATRRATPVAATAPRRGSALRATGAF
jgi:hypothetical protein